jgi:hypothetical protein
MDILYILLKLFIWAVMLGLSIIPGIIAGYFGEVLLGAFGYWIGFALGVVIFLVNTASILTFRDEKPLEKTERIRPFRRFPLFSFLAGLWMGRKFLDDD